MNKERLLILATFLETMVPPEQWDYERVVGRDWKGAQDLSCGTTGGALGWAPSIPVLRQAGMRIDCLRFAGECTFSTYQVFEAAKAVFDIDHDELNYLFVPGHLDDGYSGLAERASAKEVAKHIRRFVKRGGMPGEVVGYAVKMYGCLSSQPWRSNGKPYIEHDKPIKMTLDEARDMACKVPYNPRTHTGRKVVKIVRRRKG